MKRKVLLIVIMLSVILTACGRNAGVENNGISEPYTRTLNILVDDDRHIGVIEQTAAAMNESWQARGYPYTFRVEVENNDRESPTWPNCRADRLNVELMAGQGPDMFVSGFIRDIRSAVRSGLIADIYTLVDNCTRTSREDFFTNVLSAFEINNGLYVFPISFGFYHIGVNTGLPQVYINRFAQEPTVTIGQFLEIYLDIKDVQEFAHLSLGLTNSIDLNSRYRIIESMMGGFIDFETRTSSLTDGGFASYLALLPRVFGHYVNLPGAMSSVMPFSTNEFLRDRAGEYIFAMDMRMLSPVHAFLGDGAYFSHYRPLADDSGRLLINHSMWSDNVWATFSVTSAGQQELAWEFLQYLIQAYSQPVGSAAVHPTWGAPLPIGVYSLSTPIKRSLADEHLRRVFENIIGIYKEASEHGADLGFINFDTPEEQAAQIEAAINRIHAYNEMPVAPLSPMLPWTLFLGSGGGNVGSFMGGAITAEDFAQRVHNAVALWLIE